MLRAHLGGELRGLKGRYPHFFVYVDALGIGPMLLNVLVLSVGFLFIGYVLFGVDRYSGWRKHA